MTTFIYFFKFFVLLIWFNTESYLCNKHFLKHKEFSSNHIRKKLTNKERVFIDYNIISNLDLNSLYSGSLKDKGSVFLEDGKKILMKNDIATKAEKNQILCASATFTNELNKTG